MLLGHQEFLEGFEESQSDANHPPPLCHYLHFQRWFLRWCEDWWGIFHALACWGDDSVQQGPLSGLCPHHDVGRLPSLLQEFGISHPKHDAPTHLWLWAEDTWEAADAGGVPWPSPLYLQQDIEFPMRKVPSFYQKVKNIPITRDPGLLFYPGHILPQNTGRVC